MKKMLLTASAVVLAFSLVACANGSGGGKRVVAPSSGGSNSSGSDTKLVSLAEVSEKFFEGGDEIIIDGNTITFPANNKNSGIMFSSEVEAIEFTFPAGDARVALSYLNSKIENKNAKIYGFLLNQPIEYGNGWAVNVQVALHQNSGGDNDTSTAIREGGYGIVKDYNSETYWYAPIGTIGKLMEQVTPLNQGYKIKVTLGSGEPQVIIENVDNGKIWGSRTIDSSVASQEGLTKQLGLSRHTNFATTELKLTDVKVYLKDGRTN